MRDPNRIYKFLAELQTVWAKYPDLRFGQLLEDCLILAGHDLNSMYNLEDDEFIEIIKSFG